MTDINLLHVPVAGCHPLGFNPTFSEP